MTLSQYEKAMLDVTDIAKQVRKQLKTEFPLCKFSVTIERYSMGQSLTVALMEAPFDVRLNSKTEYAQLNHYQLQRGYYESDNGWCNGCNLTQIAWRVLQSVCEIVQFYNYDNSDLMTDYYDVNFHFSINIGKWNKQFKRSL